LDDATKKVVCRSTEGTALDQSNPYLRAEAPLVDGSLRSDVGEIHKPIQSVSDLTGNVDTSSLQLPTISPEELSGITFARKMDYERSYYAKIAQKILDNDAANHEKIKILVRIGDGEFDEIISYNELSNIVEEQHERHSEPSDIVWVFKWDQEPPSSFDFCSLDYMGS
jgi:hypothetical protein